MAAPRAADVLGRVTLVTGKEEFLNERTVGAVRDAVRRHDAEAELSETQAGRPDHWPTLGELAAPSLFSSTRCVVVRGAGEPPRRVGRRPARLRRRARSRTSPWCWCTAAARRAPALLTKLRKLDTVTEVKSAELRPSEFAGFVAAEVRALGLDHRRRGRRLPGQAVGHDLRSLAAAADQLTNDFPGEPLTDGEGQALLRRPGRGQVVRRRRRRLLGPARGRARGAALGARRRHRRRCWSPRRSPAVPAGSPATCPRPRGMREADLAREVGVPPWKLRTMRDQSRGWSDGGIAHAIMAIARADADIKGAASDAAYTLERLVLTVTGLREPR